KKPKRNFAAVAELRGTTFVSRFVDDFDRNSITGAVDVTGSLVGDTILGRIVGEISSREGFRDFAFSKSEFIMPSLTWNIGEHTALTAQYEYRHTREHFDQFLVAPQVTVSGVTFFDPSQIADITTTYQQPTDFRAETGSAVNLFLQHQFGADWRANIGYRRVRYDSNQKEFSNTGYALVAGERRVLRRARHLQTARQYDYVDANLSGNFDTFGVGHKLLVGLNFGKDLVNENRLKFFNSSNRNATTGLCPVNGTCLDIGLYNPIYTTTPAFDSLGATNPQLANQAILLTDRYVRQSNYGIYVSDLLTLTEWLKVSLGGRNFSETADVEANRRLNSPRLKRTDKRSFLPSAGVLIQPSKKVTFYGSYAQSFVPNDPALQDFNGNLGVFTPITGTQVEAGVKAENLLDNRLSFTAAVYRIDQRGQVTTDACTFGTCATQIGRGRSDGFEIEGNLTPVDNWQVILGYTHIKAFVLEARPGSEFQEGRQLPNVAKNAANMWTRYDFSNGIGIGLGVIYTGERTGVLPTTATDLSIIPLPAYTIVDAGLYYTGKGFSVNLKVGNIFDKRYIENTGATARIQISPGAPRYGTLTTRFTF
ncbi:MAG: hypothetical protein JWN21_352, partial [Sphingomonas bacterium]|uniref:TonB-dependent siderophore receptor n=1 Tax=Sphingomonas bacterium TaxID=1895847 RepID=UPI0026153F9C